MAGYNQIQNNFISGELSPLSQERYDVEDHVQAASRMENFRVLSQGGFTRRSGTICLTANLTDLLIKIESEAMGDGDDFDTYRNSFYADLALDETRSDALKMIKLIPYSSGGRAGFIVMVPYWSNEGTSEARNNSAGVQAFILFPKDQEAFNSLYADDEERPLGYNYLNEHLNTTKNGNKIFEVENFKNTSAGSISTLEYATFIEPLGRYFVRPTPISSTARSQIVAVQEAFLEDFDHAQIGDSLFIASSTGIIPPVIISPISLDTAPGSLGVGSFLGGSGLFALFTGGAWVDGSLNAVSSGPYRSAAFSYPSTRANTRETTISVASTGGSTVSLTASTDLFASPIKKWLGKVVYINQTSFTSGFLITGISSDTVATGVSLKTNSLPISATTNWSASQWGGLDGFPKTVSIYQQRVCFGGSPGYPDTVWMSGSGQLFRFYQFKANDDTNNFDDTFPFSLTPSSGDASEIRWMSSSDVLEVGCNDQEFNIIGAEGIFGPSNFSIRAHTSKGGSQVKAERLNKATFFSSKDGKNLMSYNKVYQTGEYDTMDLGVKSDFILNSDFIGNDLKIDGAVIRKFTVNRIEDTVWVLVDVPISVFARAEVLIEEELTQFNDHIDIPKWETRLYSLTYNESGNVVSMQRHKLGTSGNLDLTPVRLSDGSEYIEGTPIAPTRDPLILDMLSLDDRGVSKLLLMTMRSDGDGGDQVCLEMIRDNRPRTMIDLKGKQDNSLNQEMLEMSTYLDMHFFIKKAEKAAFTVAASDPLPIHLKGRSVTAMGYNSDNELRIFKDIQISATGEFTLPQALRSVLLGIPYSSIMTTIRVNQGSLFGSSQGLPKRTHEANIKVFKSKGGRFSPKTDMTKDSPLNYPIGSFSSDELHTGNIRLFTRNNPEEDKITIFTDDPLPLTVLNLVQRGILYDS